MDKLKIEVLSNDSQPNSQTMCMVSKREPVKKVQCPHCGAYYCKHHLAKIVADQRICQNINCSKYITLEDLRECKLLLFLKNFDYELYNIVRSKENQHLNREEIKQVNSSDVSQIKDPLYNSMVESYHEEPDLCKISKFTLKIIIFNI